MEYDEYRAMNTSIQVAAEGSRADVEPGFRRVRRLVAASEARFSRFLDDSELCQLNRAAGRWFNASAELFDVLQKALALHELSGGLFDPSILKALQQAGYDRSIDIIRASGLPPVFPIFPPADSRLNQVCLDPDRRAIYLPAEVQIDLGGIAKGWIAEKAVNLLADYAPACAVSAGGDMAFHGTPEGEQSWQVSLEDPRDAKNVLAVLDVRSGALATSSVARRRWIQAGQERHHIIDPRTGLPAEVEWVSVSVGAADAATAEAFAKAILIAGSDAAPELAAQVPGLWFIAVHPDGSLSGTPASKEMVYELI